MLSAEEILTNPPALTQSSTRLVRSHLRGDLADAVWAPAEQQACGENEVQPGMKWCRLFFPSIFEGAFLFLGGQTVFFLHIDIDCATLCTRVYLGVLEMGDGLILDDFLYPDFRKPLRYLCNVIPLCLYMDACMSSCARIRVFLQRYTLGLYQTFQSSMMTMGLDFVWENRMPQNCPKFDGKLSIFHPWWLDRWDSDCQ